MDRVVITVVGIIAAVGLSAALFIGINKLYDLAERQYAVFCALVGGIGGLLVFGILWGNRLIASPVLTTIIAGAIAAAAGYALGITEDASRRLLVGTGGGAALGLLLGSSVRSAVWPSLDVLSALIGLVVGAGLGYLAWTIRSQSRPYLGRVLMGAGIGWLFGAWLAPDFDGTKAGAFIVAAVLGALIGASIGTVPYPNAVRRGEISIASRKYIFLGPALFFVGAALVVPLLRTIWLGFLTGNPRELTWTGLTNYADILTDPGIIDFSGWTDIFTSELFYWALALAIGGVAIALWRGRSGGTGLGTGFAVTAGSLPLLIGSAVSLGFALFTAIRGTIPNNLWWIFSVIIFAVSLGLAVAVLADRSKGENIAKSLIFLPMAISFVGASVIWRLIYVARPPGDEQTGVFNSLWKLFGEWSNSGTAQAVIGVILGAIVLALLYLAYRAWQAEAVSVLAGSLATAAIVGWVLFRFLGPGFGGFQIADNGNVLADPVLFIQESPWNNFFMMVVFIWIQTGFAMVIFSAAIKAVPVELLEAARIDGATESQTFWRVTVPQIFPTIGVVVTTLIVTVLKVFDIPKVMTNGNFDTQVLANEMWERAFTQLDFGLGSAIAVILFIAVLPVMYINIRRMQRERIG